MIRSNMDVSAFAPAGWLHGRRLARSACALLVLTSLALPTALAQVLDDDPAEPSAPNVRLSVRNFLLSNRVLAENVEGPVWEVRPQQGRRLIQLPLVIGPTDAEVRLDDPPISVRGGRFVAWLIPSEEEAGTLGQRQVRGGLWSGELPDLPSELGQPSGWEFGDDAHAQDDERELLPNDAPRMTRRLTVHPDGSLEWDLERSVPGGQVREGDSGYPLKLRPERLLSLQPSRPDIPSRNANESSRDYAQRRQMAQQAYVEQVRNFQDMRRSVLRLPDKFTVSKPEIIWAVYEVVSSYPEITLTGPQPLPWSVSYADLELLQKVASSGLGRSGASLSAEGQEQASRLQQLTGTQHPLTHRLVANVIVAGNLTDVVQPNDALYSLIKVLISSPDERARRLVAQELADTTPPSDAVVLLLRSVAEQPDPVMKLMSLRGLLQADPNDGQKLHEMLETANRLLIDPQGPEAGSVIVQLLQSLSEHPQAVTAATNKIQLEILGSDRRDSAIAAVLRHAGTSPLAANWLNHRLLGAGDQDVVRRTLELTAAADFGPSPLRPVVETMLSAVFGPPKANANAMGDLNLRLVAPIPLDSPRHNLFRALSSGDEAVYQLAWNALVNFAIAGEQGGGRYPSTDAGAADECYDMLMDVALAREQTPQAFAVFLSRQDDPRATQALVKLVVTGDGPIAAKAARALLGSHRELRDPLQALSAGDRMLFATRLYATTRRGEAPQVVGLLQDEAGGEVLQWFADRVAAGDLPMPGEWSAAVGGEERLLQLACSSDPAVSVGAAAALIAAAGGDEVAAKELSARFSQQPQRTVESLRPLWRVTKQAIYARQLSNVDGRYRLMVAARPPKEVKTQRSKPVVRQRGVPDIDSMFEGPPSSSIAPSNTAAASPSETSVRVMLGIVDLMVDGQSVRLRNGSLSLGVSPDRLAIRVAQPNQLKNFQNEQVTALPLEQIGEPLDLLPESNGSWAGTVPMPDGRVLEVRLEPVSGV